jgi:hypothetical protein
MIEVHHFRIWNKQLGEWETPPSKRTVEAVAELGGEIIPDTTQMVFRVMVRQTGGAFFYGPRRNLFKCGKFVPRRLPRRSGLPKPGCL